MVGRCRHEKVFVGCADSLRYNFPCKCHNFLTDTANEKNPPAGGLIFRRVIPTAVRTRKRSKTRSYIFEAGTVNGKCKVVEKGGFLTKADVGSFKVQD